VGSQYGNTVMADIPAYNKENRRAECTLKNIILWWFEGFCVTLQSKSSLQPPEGGAF